MYTASDTQFHVQFADDRMFFSVVCMFLV